MGRFGTFVLARKVFDIHVKTKETRNHITKERNKEGKKVKRKI
jgi:hypothetical protein